MKTVLVLPTHLFEKNKLITQDTHVYIYEHPVYFKKYKYHKMKLIYHRATMKSYEDYLKTTYGCKIKYINYDENINTIFKKHKGERVDLYDPVDFDVIDDLKKYNINLFVHDTPLFLCTMKDLTEYLDAGGKYHQTSFYIWQRKRLNILLTKDGKPINEQWTFDKDNRLPFDNKFKEPYQFQNNNNKYTVEAKKYIDDNFKNNYGETNVYLPINHTQAKSHLRKFLEMKLNCFGPYQDAVDESIIFGCHSVLSPIMNVGLLTHKYVIDKTISYYEKHKTKINFASVEGFIRQIIGWANYMRFIYMFKHKQLTSSNHFNHKRKLGIEWFTGTTNIKPIDDIIKKTLKYGYAHHIERLMFLGNFMLLSKFNPKDIHDWFMTMFLDSYHVFMETNVYGMSQYSCGSVLSTRPYFSSSNYIDKMSSYKKKSGIHTKIKLDDVEYEWYEIWDALYYNFINDNKKEFSKNYAIANAVRNFNKKTNSDKKQILHISKLYLEYY